MLQSSRETPDGPPMDFVLTTAVKQTLELAMLDENYFIQEVSSHPLEEIEDQPGFFRGHCLLAQFSPLDPETGVWRRVEVYLRRQGRRYEIYDVQGLKVVSEGAKSGSRLTPPTL